MRNFLLIFLSVSVASAAPVINEIMFHPAGIPENPAQEWIEISNPDATSADVSGWRFSKGVAFSIPAATVIPAGGYLVVAANVAVFDAGHPGFAGTRVGGWVGTLANGGEQVQLDNALGVKICDVTYADEGEWAVRGRGALSFGHRGWDWFCPADGGGFTFEVRKAALGIGSGQNWASSAVVGGTPGAANSVAVADSAPLIKDVKHRPEIPRSTEAIVVSCNVEDELPGAVATLRWRLDGAASFALLAMADTDGDGDVEATIPAQAHLAVVEWYISATDGTNTRTWPAPARTNDIGVVPETFGQVTNALLQVDNNYSANATFRTPADNPIYRLIMTNVERLELAQIGSTSGEQESTATMNGTFISHDGTGLKVVFNAGFRNRGFGSALGPPNNFHVGFRSDNLWNDRASIALNCQWGYSQALGNNLFALAGIPPQETAIVSVRVNGADLASAGSQMYGRYARIEGRGGDWVKRHYPGDPDGNFYRLDDHAYGQGDPLSGEFRYEGSNPALYSDTFFKETNKEENDYGDLINFARIVSAPATGGTAEQPAIPDSAYVASVSTVLDMDQFYRFIATDALIGNQEGGLQSGRADDASIYRGLIDTRFRFIPHDMDDVFNIGNGVGDPVTRSIFSYDISSGGLTGLTRLFNHPQLVPRYYSAVLDAMNSWFTSATIDPLIDRLMTGWVPATNGASAQSDSIAEIKAFVAARRANVLAQIEQNYSLTVAGNSADTAEGYKQTTTGAATFSGTFNVARTYSITVNGVAAQWFYRTVGLDVAGTWNLVVAASGGGVLSPGLNNIVVRFWDGPGGTGSIVQELHSFLLWQPAVATYTNVSGTLVPSGTLAMTAPASYIPGIPFLVKVDLKDGAGALDRTAWNRTATLAAPAGVTLNPATVPLTNGMGSALVTASGGAGGSVTYFTYGSGGTGSTTANTGTPGSTWKYRGNFTSTTLAAFVASFGTTWKDEGFDDSTWPSIVSQTGYSGTDENDENRAFTRVDYDSGNGGTQSGPVYLFRSTFTIASKAALVSVTGQIKYDDAYRIYVNGVKVANSGLLPDSTALTGYATSTSNDNTTANITIPLDKLDDAVDTDGVNTIAIEIHQADSGSSDVTFDFQLQGNFASTDPGNFTLTANVGALNASKGLTSLTSTPAMTNVSGALPSGTTDWSGVINVTGDVTVPADGTLNIAPGTHILVAGDGTGGSSAGADIIVTTGGVVNAIGTAAQPISITASSVTTRWGEINVNGATTNWHYCLVSRAAHSPGGGHTGTGPAIRLGSGAVFTFEDGAITDLPGKTMFNSGNTTITLRRSHFGRSVMGPEIDGSAVTIEDSNFTEMLPAYRETGAQDDEDCIYIHDSGGRPVFLRRSVFSNSGDDGVDCLAGILTIEDSIIRNATDKGVSLLQNNITIRRTQIIDCDFGISIKTQIGAEASAYTATLENCTIVGEAHPTNQSDQTGGSYWHNVGIHVRNKYGTGPNAQLFVNTKNCIISTVTPMLNDYATGGNDFPLLTSTYNLYQDVAGTNPVDPAPPAGTGDATGDPLFVNAASRDFHLTAASPARDTGDPASPLDADGTPADKGALPYGTVIVSTGTITWGPGGGPYRVTAATTVPVGVTLSIAPGTPVYFDRGARLTVNGKIEALGTPEKRITFSHVPGTVAAGDCDPIKNGTQTGPPKWGGIRVTDSMAEENIFKYCDFINAQGDSPIDAENYGSLGFIRSWGFCEGLTFSGTHLRMLYGRNPKLTVIRTTFPDMMIFDAALGRIEEPTDFVAGTDNNMEPLKVEYPVEAASTGAGWSSNGLPIGGWFRVYYNDFHGNRSHNDVFDADSGRVGVAGDFLLDCRYNHFHGLSGDEHIDLGGDAYIASNIFQAATKDQWVSAFGTDLGYSNAISTGDKGAGTTIMVARNVCYDLDHVINCKEKTATIFEHNTVANLHSDYIYTPSTPDQDVKVAPINFFVPEDGPDPTRGDGAYMGFNLVSNVPRLFSGPDARKINGTTIVNDVTTKIEFFNNQLDQVLDPAIGPNHPGGIFGGTYGPNVAGAPGFVKPAGEDYGLAVTSLARRAAPGGFDFGASIPEWAYIAGGPVGTTDQTSAGFTIGGPGIVAYRWRLDGGAWSAETAIGTGAVFPRTVGVPCVRQATLALNSLTQGAHTLEVLGEDMAGNWQDADPARTAIGAAQAAPTSRTWTVDSAAPLVRISEVLANGTATADTVELHNYGSVAINVSGWLLSDDPLVPGKFPLPATEIPAGGHATFSSALLNLDKDGDSVLLFQGATQRDSVTFGRQLPDMTIGRVILENTLVWQLCTPSPGAANVPVITGDTGGIRISEWFADGDARYDNDWVELSNSLAYPVDLAGLRLTDTRSDASGEFVIPPLTFIGANGFAKFVCGGGTGQIPFGLDAEQDNLALLTAGGALLDTVIFFQQTTDYSQGRDAAGTGGVSSYELPTANLANTTTDANALALLRGLRVTEIMYNAIGGPDYDYVELTNTGASAFELAGVSFVQGISFTFGAQTLDAGQSIIVTKNSAKFRNRYGNAPLVAGNFSGQLDNGGEGVALQLPPPFDANVLTFSYSDGWYPTTDGSGFALITPVPATTAAGTWGDRNTWAASILGGQPAGTGARTDTFSGWMTLNHALTTAQDDDRDSIPALTEFTLGMNPANSNGVNGAAGLPAFAIVAGHATLSFTVPVNNAAAQSHGFADTLIEILAASEVSGPWTIIATKAFASNWTGIVAAGTAAGGSIPVIVTDTALAEPRRFLKLRATWIP